jgi:hypothetical protein
MPVRIVEVRDAKTRDCFIKFPWRIYPGRYPHWVPPLLIERRDFLDPRKNPFFEHADVALFLAADDCGEWCGRIAATVNHNHNAVYHDKTGFFGLFECVDDQVVADALFNAAAGFLKSRGLEVMRGPMNLCINDDVGLLVDGFDRPPTIMMPYNPPYYEKLVLGFGFGPIVNLLAQLGQTTSTGTGVPEYLERGVRLAQQRYRFTVRTVRMNEFDEEVRRIQQVYNSAWSENWGAVPMTDKQFRHLAKDLKMILDPDYCFIAEVDGEIAGFSLALPDINQALIHLNGRLLPFGIFKLLWYKRRINAVRIITTGVLKKFRHMGIDACFYGLTCKNSHAKGQGRGEASWILEHNTAMNRALAKMGFRITKIYRLYDRALP